jgi:pyridoxal phosphate enzyme (YggS family)
MSPSVNQSDRLRLLEDALAGVRGRIEAACRRAGRSPQDVRLIGVTKGIAGEVVGLAARAGLQDFGENYVQELTGKREHALGATWHFIGRVQSNKAPRVLEATDIVHTLEPGRAADRLARLAGERGRPLECLIEVDFTTGRVGVRPEELEPFAQRVAELPGLRLRGLMTVAPPGQDPRASFARLRELRDGLGQGAEGLADLSMGMSVDLEAAVEEGATMVRVGTAIFGPRPARRR